MLLAVSLPSFFAWLMRDFAWLMAGACHHLSSARGIIDNRLKAHKAFPSIAGAKIQRFSVSTKFWHVIRSDFQQTYDLKL